MSGRTVARVARATFHESVRDRALYGLVAFAVLLIAASLLVAQLTAGQDMKIVKDLGLAAMSLIGLFIATLALVPQADPRLLCEEIERWRATHINAIPAVWRRILDHLDTPEGKAHDLSSLRMVDSGTSATPPDLLAAIKQAVPHATRRVFYGSTEAGAVTLLREDEIEGLNRIVVMFLDFAEDQARRRKQIFLQHWTERLDEFLRFNERNVLDHAGQVSHDAAEAHAHHEYDRFPERRRVAAEDDAERQNLEEIRDAIRSLPRAERDATE